MQKRIKIASQMAIEAAKAPVSLTAALRRALVAATLCAAFSQPGLAAKTQEPARASAGYIDAVPKDKRYRLYVLGDSLASNLADGLVWALRDVDDVRVIERTKAATGLVRDDIHNWTRSVAELLESERVDIAVIAIGGNDRQDIRAGGKRYERFTRPWRIEYRRRVARFMRTLDDSGSAVYWVGLPPVRSRQMTRDYQRFNAHYGEIARAHGIKFVDIFDRFRSAPSGYTAYGRGIAGKVTRLREGDGIHFTLVGSRRLGQIVAEEIRRDLRSARAAQPASPNSN